MTDTTITAPADQTAMAFTDGSCIGNPGPGGWAWLIQSPDGTSKSSYGHISEDTTNIRMEMLAVALVLEDTPEVPSMVIRTDCMMIVQGVNDWMRDWKANGWKKKSNRKPVLNKDLWERIDTAMMGREVRFEHVKAHTGIDGNEAVDNLAYRGACNE